MPVPGGPTRSAPLGIRAPSLNFLGGFEKFLDLGELLHGLVGLSDI